jgi:hypothetical protein
MVNLSYPILMTEEPFLEIVPSLTIWKRFII